MSLLTCACQFIQPTLHRFFFIPPFTLLFATPMAPIAISNIASLIRDHARGNGSLAIISPAGLRPQREEICRVDVNAKRAQYMDFPTYSVLAS